MWQYNSVYSPDELYHFGIKGMKWGVRRYQNKDGSLTSAGKKRYDSDIYNEEINDEKRRLTSKQKKAIAVGAGIAAAMLVTYGAYKLGAFDRFKKSGMDAVKDIIEDTIDSTTGFKLKKDKTISDTAEAILKDLKSVNPSQSNTNCRACSIASILRFKGYDVEAIGDVRGGSFSSAIKQCFKDPKITEMYSPTKERVTSFIQKKFEEGSSGAMSAEFDLPTGKFQHAFNWMLKDGKVSFMDGQSGSGDISKYLDFLSSDSSAEITRLDNLEVNLDGIKEFIKNR